MKSFSLLATRSLLAASAVALLAAISGCHNGPHPLPPPTRTDGKDGKDIDYHNGPHPTAGNGSSPTPGPVQMSGPHQ